MYLFLRTRPRIKGTPGVKVQESTTTEVSWTLELSHHYTDESEIIPDRIRPEINAPAPDGHAVASLRNWSNNRQQHWLRNWVTRLNFEQQRYLPWVIAMFSQHCIIGCDITCQIPDFDTPCVEASSPDELLFELTTD
ncbi:hypothetical protein Tco_1209295 [Tanacetum coccineum]